MEFPINYVRSCFSLQNPILLLTVLSEVTQSPVQELKEGSMEENGLETANSHRSGPNNSGASAWRSCWRRPEYKVATEAPIQPQLKGDLYLEGIESFDSFMKELDRSEDNASAAAIRNLGSIALIPDDGRISLTLTGIIDNYINDHCGHDYSLGMRLGDLEHLCTFLETLGRVGDFSVLDIFPPIPDDNRAGESRSQEFYYDLGQPIKADWKASEILPGTLHNNGSGGWNRIV
jgi:hypothetical protein